MISNINIHININANIHININLIYIWLLVLSGGVVSGNIYAYSTSYWSYILIYILSYFI